MQMNTVCILDLKYIACLLKRNLCNSTKHAKWNTKIRISPLYNMLRVDGLNTHNIKIIVNNVKFSLSNKIHIVSFKF